MKVTVDRDPLVKALAHVLSPVDGKSTIDILKNVLLTATAGKLHLTATNLDLEASTSLSAETQEDGAVTVAAKDLYETARRALPGADLLLFLNDGDPRLRIRTGRSNFALPTLPATDFPVMPELDDAARFTMLRSEFIRLVDKVGHAISNEETRYYLTGGYLHTVSEDGADYLRMAATDGNRLAVVEMPAPMGALEAPAVIVPRKTLDLARAIADAGNEDVELIITRAKFGLRCGRSAVTSKVIDGSFVDYTRVIPRGDAIMTVRTKGTTLSRAMAQASIMSKDKTPSLKFDFSDDGLTVSARSTEGGQADAQIDTQHDGEAISVAFNTRYVNDVASLIGDADLIITMEHAEAPMRIVDTCDSSVTYVVSPQRV